MNIQTWLTAFTDFYREIGFLSKYKKMSVERFVNLLTEWDCERMKELEVIIDDCDFLSDIFSCDYSKVGNGEPDYEADLDSKYNKMHDLRLLGLLDKKRVWWRWKDNDYEFQGNNNGRKKFSKIINRFSEISRGAFVPENIKEKKGENEDNVVVSFMLDNKQHHLLAKYKHEDVGFGEMVLPDLQI